VLGPEDRHERRGSTTHNWNISPSYRYMQDQERSEANGARLPLWFARLWFARCAVRSFCTALKPPAPPSAGGDRRAGMRPPAGAAPNQPASATPAERRHRMAEHGLCQASTDTRLSRIAVGPPAEFDTRLKNRSSRGGEISSSLTSPRAGSTWNLSWWRRTQGAQRPPGWLKKMGTTSS